MFGQENYKLWLSRVFLIPALLLIRNVKRKKAIPKLWKPWLWLLPRQSPQEEVHRRKRWILFRCVFYLFKLFVVAKNCCPWKTLMNGLFLLSAKMIIFRDVLDRGKWVGIYARWGTGGEYQPSQRKLWNHDVLTQLVSHPCSLILEFYFFNAQSATDQCFR